VPDQAKLAGIFPDNLSIQCQIPAFGYCWQDVLRLLEDLFLCTLDINQFDRFEEPPEQQVYHLN
jgi:hypothetical protein